MVCKVLRLKPAKTLGKDEFWALQDIAFIVKRGECLGIIGPNGAGKSTLLKLIHRELRPDAGRILALGSIKSLLRINTGLQPLLSGRENIYIRCQQMGLSKDETDAKLNGIIAFAGLDGSIDALVKTYSDGMYSRLEFSIATSVEADIFLMDEVLSVGDIAFQIRALDRLNQLKQGGAAIVFVSHSEMNVRHVADRCLLLFNGRQLALGKPDALFYKYYESVGYLTKNLQALDGVSQNLVDFTDKILLNSLRSVSAHGESASVRVGGGLDLSLQYDSEAAVSDACLILHFRNLAGLLVASVNSSMLKQHFQLNAGKGEIRLRIPFMPLTPGCYRVAGGFIEAGQWLVYQRCLMELYVEQSTMPVYDGLVIIQAEFEIDTLL